MPYAIEKITYILEKTRHIFQKTTDISQKTRHIFQKTTEISHHKGLYTLQHLRNNSMKFCSESNDR